MALVRLEERFAFGGGKVRRPGDAGYAKPHATIEGALLCGATSLNNRDYPPGAFAERKAKRYENRPVYVNHGDGRGGRRVEERLAWVENEGRNAAGLPTGDICVNPKHPQAESVLWWAEHKPDALGMSHVAHCKTRRGPDGRDVVEDVAEVESVDIVVGPATTKGFFEQDQRGRTNVAKTTLLKALEAAVGRLPADRAKPARRALVLAEDDAGVAPLMGAEVDDPDAATDPDQAITDAFRQAMHAQVDALLEDSHTLADFKSKCGELYKSLAKIQGKAAPKDGDAGGADDKPKEQAVKPADPWAVVEDARAEQYQATPTELKMVAALPTSAERRAYFREQKARRPGETPASPGRHGADRLSERDRKGGGGTTQEQAAPADPKAFAASIRG